MIAEARVGDLISFAEEQRPYRVRARSDRFLVCTKPFNLRRTVLYTVVDIKRNIRGTEDLVFSLGAETDEECAEMVRRLTGANREEPTEVSYRNNIPLNVVTVRKGKR